MEVERMEEQEAYIQAHVRLPPKQVYQSRSKGSSYKVAEILDEARTPRATEANKTQGQREGNCRRGMIRGIHDLHTFLTLLVILAHLARQVFREAKCNGVLHR
jgi:hypothetical protein